MASKYFDSLQIGDYIRSNNSVAVIVAVLKSQYKVRRVDEHGEPHGDVFNVTKRGRRVGEFSPNYFYVVHNGLQGVREYFEDTAREAEARANAQAAREHAAQIRRNAVKQSNEVLYIRSLLPNVFYTKFNTNHNEVGMVVFSVERRMVPDFSAPDLPKIPVVKLTEIMLYRPETDYQDETKVSLRRSMTSNVEGATIYDALVELISVYAWS